METKIILEGGLAAKASVPSGASTGAYEALELRDGDKNRYGGLGVKKAVEGVNKIIAQEIAGIEVAEQKTIDKRLIKLDGTENKSFLGANAMLSVSLACARAGALTQKKELYEYIGEIFDLEKRRKLPVPCFNIFNGGKHADTNLDFQEFMIIPAGGAIFNPPFSREEKKKRFKSEEKYLSFSEMVRMGAEIFHELGGILKQVGYDTDVGNEGGYAPDIISSVQAIELILAAVKNAGYQPGRDIGLGIDVGSSVLFNKKTNKYIFKLDNSHFTSDSLIGLYYEWFRKYPIILIEDGLGEDDWEEWRKLTKELGSEILLVGDDLFVTNVNRLRKGIGEKVANSILIKPNQIGTLSETIECVKLAQKHNYKIVVSHRSGETGDDFIADLAVAVGADYIKAGSLSRGERVAKYNRLMDIEENLKIK